ncbi:MAG: pyridoxamine 5'-phosphate oxidase [Solirubrobacteraceae bacterium]|jgi:pyridoxamine 5'-phosphate oxidase
MTDRVLPLTESDADPDPLRQFTGWFADAAQSGVSAPEAAAIATATPDGRPSVRMVLVKRVDEHGLVFFTNYESRKGRELAANPRGALLFHYDALARQIRIEGPTSPIAPEESAAYAASRARGSQLSALASPQSRRVEDRAVLEQRVAELAEHYAGRDLPLPATWGGVRLVPDRFEFWQGRDDRLHDRLLYTPGPDGGWQIERLAP